MKAKIFVTAIGALALSSAVAFAQSSQSQGGGQAGTNGNAQNSVTNGSGTMGTGTTGSNMGGGMNSGAGMNSGMNSGTSSGMTTGSGNTSSQGNVGPGTTTRRARPPAAKASFAASVSLCQRRCLEWRRRLLCAAASASSFCACFRCGMSSIWPSSPTTPSLDSANAATTRFAQAISRRRREGAVDDRDLIGMDRHHAAKAVAPAGHGIGLQSGEIAKIRIDGLDRARPRRRPLRRGIASAPSERSKYSAPSASRLALAPSAAAISSAPHVRPSSRGLVLL